MGRGQWPKILVGKGYASIWILSISFPNIGNVRFSLLLFFLIRYLSPPIWDQRLIEYIMTFNIIEHPSRDACIASLKRLEIHNLLPTSIDGNV